jgi:hypothetical protein
MDNIKEGGSVNRSSVLDGTNYDYWKAKTIALFKSMDNKTWKTIIKSWKHPVNTSQDIKSF